MAMHGDHPPVEPIDEVRWRIPKRGRMNTEGLVFASEALMETMRADKALEQVRNVACLPGIVGPSLGMPDLHWGYGFPIGGVAGFDPDEGVLSPGAVGFDINCGVRLLRSDVDAEEARPAMARLADALFRNVPCGVGAALPHVRLTRPELDRCLRGGAAWAVEHGYGEAGELEHMEESGRLEGGDPAACSERAKERGADQLGTLGSGNHFLEVDRVAEVYDDEAARVLGLVPGKLAVLIHCGSRGFGHQVCTDHLPPMKRASAKYGIELADPQLACAPFRSPEAQRYFGAMKAAVNFAFANRTVIAHHARKAFREVLGEDARLGLVYDVCHNIAKLERHEVDGVERELVVHRKGATRAFPPGHPLTPKAYRHIGQPVIVPGDMGRYSFMLVGQPGSKESLGSCCHGAGRVESRTKAKATTRGRDVRREMQERGITVRAASRATLDEEHSGAYKDVADVVDVVDRAGLARLVARLEPMAVVKG
jgi:tRNA-splicing ligase RtcB